MQDSFKQLEDRNPVSILTPSVYTSSNYHVGWGVPEHEALPGFKLITPLISMNKYNSWRENRVYTLYGKMYFWNCISNHTEFKSGGTS